MEITLYKKGIEEKVTVIIDSGSPYTIIPTKFLTGFRFKPEDRFTDILIHGVIHKEECAEFAPVYLLGVKFDGADIPKTSVVGYDFHSEYGLLGHNVLSRFRLVIDWKTKQIKLE